MGALAPFAQAKWNLLDEPRKPDPKGGGSGFFFGGFDITFTDEGGDIMKKSVAHKTIGLFLAMILAVFWTLAASPAAAQGTGAGPLLEKPQPSSEVPGPGEKKEEAPTTCGPLISDSCIPIEEHHASMQVLAALSFYTANFSRNWRTVTAARESLHL